MMAQSHTSLVSHVWKTKCFTFPMQPSREGRALDLV